VSSCHTTPLYFSKKVCPEAGGNANIYRFYYPSTGNSLDGELNGNTLTIKDEGFDEIYTRE